MPVLVSSTLPCLGTARPGRIFAPKAPSRPWYESESESEDRVLPSVEILEVVDQGPQPSPPEPTVVCGYRIGTLLGRGGLSVLFEVTHPDSNEPLAMKVITDQRLQHDLAADAIYTHAQSIATVDSPHVVRTLDAGRLPSGEPFVVMERLDGEDLEARLRNAPEGRLPLAEAIDLVMQACEGLAEAHAIGIVHGDIKPANLLVVRHRRNPCLKIIDFAPSVPRASHPDDPLVTCSPGYASPEQLGARRDVDGRADVWALGAVLYELVTGTRAFTAATLPEMLQVIGRVPPSMRGLRPEVPEALDIVVRRCLAREREMRFATPRQLRAALAAIKGVGAATNARDMRGGPTMRKRGRPTAKRGRLPRALFLAALGPASALVSMTLVRLVMASNLVAGPPPPPRWPAPEPLTTTVMTTNATTANVTTASR